MLESELKTLAEILVETFIYFYTRFIIKILTTFNDASGTTFTIKLLVQGNTFK